MKDPVYIIYKGRLLDMLPGDVWHKYDYFEILKYYGIDQSESVHFDWLLTHNGTLKWSDKNLSINDTLKHLMKRTA